MSKLIIENCPACEPVNRLIEDIENRGFLVIESKLEDYHFHQLYFKINTSISNLINVDFTGFTKSENYLVCDCHWSRLEFIKETESPTT